MDKPIQMAVLDDYYNLSPPYFSHLPAPEISITTFSDTIPPSDQPALITRLKPFSIISTMRERTPFPRELIQSLPNLRLLLTTGMRNNALDLEACKEAGIVVAGTTAHPIGAEGPAKGASSTTQHTWALILGLTNNIPRDDMTIKAGGWQREFPLGFHLAGKTFACLGLGKLGTAAAQIAVTAFGMRIIAWSASLTQETADEQAKSAGLAPGTFEVVPSKAALFEKADLLSIHYVLSARSRDIVSATELALMQPSAMFVNTSRGPLVNEDALYDILNAGKIRGAALDVYWTEPMPKESRWRTTKWGHANGRSELVLTPHSAYVTGETMASWMTQTCAHVESWMQGDELTNRMV